MYYNIFFRKIDNFRHEIKLIEIAQMAHFSLLLVNIMFWFCRSQFFSLWSCPFDLMFSFSALWQIIWYLTNSGMFCSHFLGFEYNIVLYYFCELDGPWGCNSRHMKEKVPTYEKFLDPVLENI